MRKIFLAALVLTVALAGPGFAAARPADMHHGFDGHHDHFRFGPVFPYYGYYPPYYGYPAPAYGYYYCPSYGTYYPNVTTCPETWVPVPAS